MFLFYISKKKKVGNSHHCTIAGWEEGGKIWNKRKDYEIGEKAQSLLHPTRIYLLLGREREREKWSKQWEKSVSLHFSWHPFISLLDNFWKKFPESGVLRAA